MQTKRHLAEAFSDLDRDLAAFIRLLWVRTLENLVLFGILGVQKLKITLS